MDQLNGTLMRYPWGTTDAIADILGLDHDASPIAEYWLGAHPLSPSQIGDRPLHETIAADPSTLGEASTGEFGEQLPFLMKVLSAKHALSIQAHPSREQAEEGYASEDAAGIPATAPDRSYKDPWPKPEVIVALEEFHTLYGFRSPLLSWQLFNQLGVGADVLKMLAPLSSRGGEAGVQEVFLDVLSIDGDRTALVDHVLAAASRHVDAPGERGEFARTALELQATFGADPGILAALLMNRVTLAPGEALYVPPGRMHAHLSGTGIEVMATSDNVLRGGLTTKHIAVDELVRVVDFAWVTPEILPGAEVAPGVIAYPTQCREFDVWRLEPAPGRTVAVPGDGHARIAFVTRGEATFAGPETHALRRGEAVFIPAQDAALTLTGDAQVFLAAPGLH